MKVRQNNGLGSIWQVIEESTTFYIAHLVSHLDDVAAEPMILRKSDYTPVSTETWRHVTAECEAGEAYMNLFHVHKRICKPTDFAGYRLRKVQLYERLPNDPMYFQHPPQYKLIDAFIVEQREP